MNRRNFLRKMGLALGGTAVAGAIGEYFTGRAYKSLSVINSAGKMTIERNLAKLREEAAEDTFNVRRHPFINWDNTPNIPRQHNSHGFRNGDVEFPMDKPIGQYRVLALGSSTTYGFFIGKPEDTWPLRLQELLKLEYPKKDILVMNAGVNGVTSGELFHYYCHRGRLFNPDLVVVHTGINDVRPELSPDYDPEYINYNRREKKSAVYDFRPWEASLVEHSNIVKLFYVNWFSGAGLDDSAVERRDSKSKVERVLESRGVGFRRNISGLVDFCLANGSSVILFPEPVVGQERYLELFSPDMTEATITGLNRHNSDMERLALERVGNGAHYLPIDKNAFPDSLFRDNCHFGENGEGVVAQYVCDYIKELDLIEQ